MPTKKSCAITQPRAEMRAPVLLQDQGLPSKALKVGLRIFNRAKRMDAIVRDLLVFFTPACRTDDDRPLPVLADKDKE